MVKIMFEDGKSKDFKEGVSALDIAKEMGINALAAVIDDKSVEISASISKDSKLAFITFGTSEGKEIFHHTSAHILAQAVKRLFPKAKPTIGPSIEGGFYYDFDIQPLTPEDLKRIEKEMKKIIHENIPIERKEISKKEALKLFRDNEYKIELIKEMEDEKVSIYIQGDFTDLCRGPHLPNTKMVKAVKLTKVSGCNWRADVSRQPLQRVYGVSFPDKEQLKKHVKLLEEAAKRDHRKIGKELDFFSFHEEGAGFPFWHDKGMILYDEVLNYMKTLLRKKGYQEIKTPIILHKDLWLKSGHWDHYKNNMYFTEIDGIEHAVKPMNCPGGLLVYKNSMHSYKELPIKAGEFGLVHRHELSGVLTGLFRVRSFTQDDAHVFCTAEQLEEEIRKLIELVLEVYSSFGFNDCHIELSTKPEDSMGDAKLWEKAETALINSLKKAKIDYKLNPGDGAFYGPKIDFHIKDCMGRSWQCGTIQVDFSMPERFDLTYENAKGRKERPVMIHRAILGSLERFIAILIEHYAGKLPLWLSPVQVKILTIADRFESYAENVAEQLKKAGIRVEIDNKSDTMGKKVRNAQLQKVNYILTVGEREEKEKTIAVRTRDNKVKDAETDAFLKRVLKEIKEKR